MVARAANVVANRYRLEAVLGRGGMGEVYCAYDPLADARVALKRVYLGAPGLGATDTPLATAFRREALAHEFQVMAGLRHPHIVDVLDYGFDHDGAPFFTMTLLHGARDLGVAAARLPWAARLGLAADLLHALAYLHRRGVVHRDLKPGNVLVEADGRLRVLDFGLATLREGRIGGGGTLGYMAPEALRDAPMTPASDLYTVGVMLFQLLTGALPHPVGAVNAYIHAVLNTPPDLSPLIAASAQHDATASDGLFTHAPDVVSIVARLLMKRPEDRYPSAEAVLRDLEAAVALPQPAAAAEIREGFLQAAQFVGREREFDLLNTALFGALAGQGETWLVGGESGVGKSRLLNEVAIRAMVAGAVVMRGQAVRDGGLPFALWRDPVRRMILLRDLDDDTLGVLDPLVGGVARLVRRPVPPAPPLDARAAQKRLVATIAALFQGLPVPVVLLLEDLQWSSESLIPLRVIAAHAAKQPLLMIGTYRNDERPDLPDDLPGARVLPLARLSTEAIARLSASMLGDNGHKPEVLDFLARHTEGNVFFLVETVRALADNAGGMSRVGVVTLPDRVFAGGMQALVRQRLERLPSHDHTLLALAAVAGRVVDVPVLRHAAAASAPDVGAFLMAASAAAVLEPLGAEWRFAHDKLREAVLDALPAEDAAQLHRRVALAIEAVYAHALETYAEALLGHWRAAHDATREAHYSMVVGRARRMLGHHSDGLALLLRARALGYEAHNTRAQARRLAFEMAACYFNIGDFDDALANLGIMLASARADADPVDEADAIALQSEVLLRQNDLERALALSQQALAIRRVHGTPSSVGGNLMTLGMILYHMGRTDEALAASLEALALLEAADDQLQIARTLNNLGGLYVTLGDIAASRAATQRAYTIRVHIKDQDGIATSLANMAFDAQDDGDLPQALDLLMQAMDKFAQVGNRPDEAKITTIAAEIAIDAHNLGMAETLLAHADMLLARPGLPHLVQRQHYTWALLAIRRDDTLAALEALRQALAVDAGQGWAVTPPWSTLVTLLEHLVARAATDDALWLAHTLDAAVPASATRARARLEAILANLPPNRHNEAPPPGVAAVVEALWTRWAGAARATSVAEGS